MLKNKIVTHWLCTMFFVAAPLAVAVTPGHADAPVKVWPEGNVRMIDWETHNDSNDIVRGIYRDRGWNGNPGWRTGYWPYGSMNDHHRYLSTWQEGYSRSGIAFWSVQIPKTGFYKLESCYKGTHNRARSADWAVYVNTTMEEVINRYPATSPPVGSIGYKVVDEYSENYAIPWIDHGTYCLQEGDVSMIVDDGRDGNQSDDADASRWTYVGEKNKSQRCGGADITPILHPLLIRNKKN